MDCFLTTGSAVDTWRSQHLVRSPRPSLAFTALGLLVLAIAASPFYLAFTHSGLPAPPSLGPLALALSAGVVATIAGCPGPAPNHVASGGSASSSSSESTTASSSASSSGGAGCDQIA